MIRYVLTSFPGVDRVNLSRRGDWGGLPYSCATEARRAARADARSHPFTIEQEAARRRPLEA